MKPPERLKRLFRGMKSRFDAIVILSPENVRYFSGFTGTAGAILATQTEAHFFTDPRYELQSHEQVKGFVIHIVRNEDSLKVMSSLAKKWKVRALGVEEAHLTIQEKERVCSRMEKVRLVPIQKVIGRLRVIKDQSEIARISKACAISDRGLGAVLQWIRPGVAEREIAEELEYQMRKAGGSKLAFDTIVASGHRAALPHGIASSKKLEKGDFVVIDFGAEFEGYKADITRTFILGSPTSRQKKVWKAVQESQQRGIQSVRAGILCKKIDRQCRDVLRKYSLEKYFTHGTGHGVGLDIHESPTLSLKSVDRLKAGMVVTVEPGVYIKRWGGVRIEDTLLVTRNGATPLTQSPKVMSL